MSETISSGGFSSASEYCRSWSKAASRSARFPLYSQAKWWRFQTSAQPSPPVSFRAPRSKQVRTPPHPSFTQMVPSEARAGIKPGGVFSDMEHRSRSPPILAWDGRVKRTESQTDHLVSGGQTTTAQMFVNLASGQRGLVCLWDVVAFDEAAGVRFTDKSGLNIMKGYMEDGAFSRGRDVITAEGSVVFVGNIDGDIETIVRTSNLFYPLPKEMDTAFYDRIHAYIPGWEFQKTSDAAYTDHFGVVSDYLAEVFRELRKQSYVDYAERYFSFGSHLGGRDQKAVRKIVSGLIKLLHPHGEVSREEAEEYLAYALEMRRRVKEQLKKMGGLEYWDTSFSYTDRESGQETFVPVPEMGAGSLIAEGGLPPGSVYTIGSDIADNRLAFFLLQTQMNRGSGRIIPLGNLSGKMKEAIKTADAYLKANVHNLGIDHDLMAYDFTVQAINLNQAQEGAETAVAFFLSLVSSILDQPVLDRTVVSRRNECPGPQRSPHRVIGCLTADR